MIGPLIAYLSMDVSFKLIAAGIVAFSANVIAATNASPIVVTIDKDYPYGGPFHGTLSGALGNTAANGIWEFTPVGPRQLALKTYTPQGSRVDSAGDGAWTSGGLVQVALPAPGGRILLGRRHLDMDGAPPRIVAIPCGPVKFSFDPYGGIIPEGSLPRQRSDETAEQQAMLLARQTSTERQRFEFHVWGAANPPDPDFADFDVTQFLYHQVAQSIYVLCTGMDILGGTWKSQGQPGEGLVTRGHEYVLAVAIDQPVIDQSLLFVSTGTSGTIVVNFEGGSPDDAQTIQVVP